MKLSCFIIAYIFEDKRILAGDINSLTLPVVNAIGTDLANSVESDLGCTSRIYFDNVTLTSQKPCQHKDKCDCSITNGHKSNYVFSIKYRYRDILLKNT